MIRDLLQMKTSLKVLILCLFLLSASLTIYSLASKKHLDLSELQRTEKLNFKTEVVADGLQSPWGMVFLDNGDLLFTEKRGELRLIRNGQLLPEPIKGLPEIYVHGQGGLLDLELHPNYRQNGWIYMSYSSPSETKGESGENTTLMRARIRDHELVDKQVIFKASPNTTKGQHFGGRIEFDNDGYLYLSVGERGERDRAQKLNTYNGKIFRMKDDGSVPADNPFFNKQGAIPLIYSYGHRNPQGLAIHPVTGGLWETEHGPKGGDEVNIIRRGKNYGWPEITFGINYNGTIITKDTAKAGMEQPVTYWVPSIAPCGMSFVTSSFYPEWKNNLLVGSLKFQYVVRCELKGNKIVHQEKILEGLGRVRCIRQGPDGYIYVSAEGYGKIVKLVPV